MDMGENGAKQISFQPSLWTYSKANSAQERANQRTFSGNGVCQMEIRWSICVDEQQSPLSAYNSHMPNHK